MQYSGLSITVPAKSLFVIDAELAWTTGQPYVIALATDEAGETFVAQSDEVSDGHPITMYSRYVTEETTYYIFGKWGGATKRCRALIYGCYIRKII